MTLPDNLRIYIGYDSKEPIAYHVLAHSLISKSTRPLEICPLALNQLDGHYYRNDRGSTDFTFSRFLVPKLSDFKGVSIFMDCDMLAQVDIGTIQRDIDRQPDKAVLVCKHEYVPKSSTKFLGQTQTTYPKKNWSSFIIFRNDRCKALNSKYVNSASPMDLHRFNWLQEEEVGSLPLDWNWLVGEYEPNPKARMLHWTNGGPWFEDTQNTDHADLWFAEKNRMEGK